MACCVTTATTETTVSQTKQDVILLFLLSLRMVGPMKENIIGAVSASTSDYLIETFMTLVRKSSI